MATSGSTDFNETRNEIITYALQLLGAVGAGETAQANDITFCSGILNAMVKAWMAQGIHLWTEEEGTIYLVDGQAAYPLQSGITGSHASDGTGTPVETTLSAAAATSATTITCTLVTGMTVADVIGIKLDTDVIWWTTISAINTTTKVVTLTVGLSGAAASGNCVFTYTTQLGRVISIQDCRLRDSANFDRTIAIKPRMDYERIPQKFLTGDPNIIYYTPQITNGILYVWPTPSDVSKRLKVTYLRTIQDFDNSTDNPDFPQEWIECIVYNLAVRIAPAYGITLSSGGIQGSSDISRMAHQFLEDLKAWDSEQPYVQIVPGWRYK